jgi:hypothetical protein
MRMTPIATAEVFLRLLPLDLNLEAKALSRKYRLCHSKQWKPKYERFGHAHVLQHNERT